MGKLLLKLTVLAEAIRKERTMKKQTIFLTMSKQMLLFVSILLLLGCPLYEVTIENPFNGEHFEVGEEITFQGSAKYVQDGELDDSSLIWTSDRDGEIGMGMEFTRDDLSEGMHRITLIATDSLGEQSIDTIAIQIASSLDDTSVGEIEYEYYLECHEEELESNYKADLEKVISGTIPFYINDNGMVKGNAKIMYEEHGFEQSQDYKGYITYSVEGTVDVEINGRIKDGELSMCLRGTVCFAGKMEECSWKDRRCEEDSAEECSKSRFPGWGGTVPYVDGYVILDKKFGVPCENGYHNIVLHLK